MSLRKVELLIKDEWQRLPATYRSNIKTFLADSLSEITVGVGTIALAWAQGESLDTSVLLGAINVFLTTCIRRKLATAESKLKKVK